MTRAALGERLGAWLPGGADVVTVLSIDGLWLKLLHASGGWRARTITLVAAIPVQGLSDADVVRQLQAACQANGFEPAGVIVANPAHLTTTRLFPVPSADWQEIRDIVELQAEKHTPYAKEEILSDFTVIDTDSSGYSRVMLIISHQDVVHRGIRIVEAMGWPLERVGFELEGLVAWFTATAGAGKPPTLVVDVDAQTTTMVVVQGGKPYFHRSVPFGAADLVAETAGEPSRLGVELRRSLDAFEAEGLNIAVAEVMLTGQIERLPDLKDQVQKTLELPVAVAAPFERIAISEAAAAGARESRVSFAGLAGLMSGGAIDLTPKPLRLHRLFEQRARALVMLGCQLILALVLASAVIIGKAYRNERHHAWLTREYQRTGPQAEAMEFDLKKLELVSRWTATRGQFLDALVEVSRHASDEIRLESLEFTRDDRVVIKGLSSEMPKVYEMVTALKASNWFAEVEAPRRVAKKREGNAEVTSFELTCLLKAVEAS
jgi:Tfp pilus assembly PilM family ATPase